MWLTILAISVGTVTLVVWLVAGMPLEFSLERMVTVVVITWPHALGLAVPLVVAVSLTEGRFSVTDVVAFGEKPQVDVLALAVGHRL
jgi:Cu2+-exporting ATPase